MSSAPPNASKAALAKMAATIVVYFVKLLASPIQYTNPAWWLTAATTAGVAAGTFGTSWAWGLKAVVAGVGGLVVTVYTHEHHATERHANALAVQAAALEASRPPPPAIGDVVAGVMGALGAHTAGASNGPQPPPVRSLTAEELARAQQPPPARSGHPPAS